MASSARGGRAHEMESAIEEAAAAPAPLETTDEVNGQEQVWWPPSAFPRQAYIGSERF